VNKYQEVNEVNKELVDRIYEVLEEVMDPELGIDIVNLGLVYEVEVNEEKQAFIKMTMTSMGCPMAGQIMADSKMKLSMNLKELTNIQIDIVWNPPWGKNHMSRYAKIALGIHD
jgi:metal-sulfur cluster biosynthetic enzyme